MSLATSVLLFKSNLATCVLQAYDKVYYSDPLYIKLLVQSAVKMFCLSKEVFFGLFGNDIKKVEKQMLEFTNSIEKITKVLDSVVIKKKK